MAQTANPKIKRALVSVSNKEGIVDFCKSLSTDHGVEIISTGGTLKTLQEASWRVFRVPPVEIISTP